MRRQSIFARPVTYDATGRPRRPGQWKPALVVIVVVALADILHGSTVRTPRLAADCSRPALLLSADTVSRHAPVGWAATGPATARVVLAIGAGIRPEVPGWFAAVPGPGIPAADTQAASGEVTLTGCLRHGSFEVTVQPGRYQVTLFQVVAGRGGRRLASAPLTVSE
jgi:hypothetical protein